MPLKTVSVPRTLLKLTTVSLCALLACVPPLHAQSSSSSQPQGERAGETQNPAARPRAAQIEQGGAAVTLEYNEPLFELAAALNVCGYDADLANSAKVRGEVRTDLNQALAASEAARASRDALCGYLLQHKLTDSAQNVGQYISLALYLSPPPELTPNVDETQLPPQAAAVVNVLPLLRTFAEATELHPIFVRHRPEYEALAARVHDPMTQMLLSTNIYLHQPVSSYDGRRFLVLLEPMLSPAVTNARIYGSDYIVVMSPDNTPTAVPVRIDDIRHIYLHYVIEPFVYSRGSAMQRIQPLLRGVADAPIPYEDKSDVEALLTECLIKAVEAHLYKTTEPPPLKAANKSHAEMDRYEQAKANYDRETAAAQQVVVVRSERAGWVLTGYFYGALAQMDRKGDGLRDEIAPMIYGLDVEGERKRASEIAFVPETGRDPLGRTMPARQRAPEGIDLAEAALMKGNIPDAAGLAEKEMAEPGGDHGRAQYVLARIDLMQGQPDRAMQGFQSTLKLSQDPRTVAWSHIYLGRLYDNASPPDREHAVTEYQAALAARDARPDTRLAAENGIKAPFALPRREQPKPKDDDAAFDPTGKAQKEAYKPAKPQ